MALEKVQTPTLGCFCGVSWVCFSCLCRLVEQTCSEFSNDWNLKTDPNFADLFLQFCSYCLDSSQTMEICTLFAESVRRSWFLPVQPVNRDILWFHLSPFHLSVSCYNEKVYSILDLCLKYKMPASLILRPPGFLRIELLLPEIGCWNWSRDSVDHLEVYLLYSVIYQAFKPGICTHTFDGI